MNELGELRPSQLIFTFGVGALVDLPKMSALIMGLDDWDTRYCKEIEEDRLIAAVQGRLGPQLSKLYLPPVVLDGSEGDPSLPAVGVPVAPFPRWLRCTLCDTLATIDSGVFQLSQDRYHADKTQYVHQGCVRSRSGRSPAALSARFLLACRAGHMTDFPWVTFVHNGRPACRPSQLTLREYGASGEASDIIVTCLSCDTSRRMADAFDPDASYACSGHHPHLRSIEEGCTEVTKPILLGASNSWFPTAVSALSIPRVTDRLGKMLDEHWVDFKDADSIDEIKFMRRRIQTFQHLIPLFSEFQDGQIWAGIEGRRTDTGGVEGEAEDLKLPEWQVFSAPSSAVESKDFKLREVAAPRGYESFFENTVLVERIREVRALIGFTRIESNSDFAEATRVADARITPLRRDPPEWIPASEVRGEGIFLRVKEDKILAWESTPDVLRLRDEFIASHRAWRQLRRLEPFDANFPGMRTVFLHSLAHALMRQIVLDCGYSAASIRERLYSRGPGENGGPMAGILIYTAAPDSEGTLGGLVELGDPLTLGRNLQQALECMRLCASDPLCAEHEPDITGRGIHGACCHACLFAPETSCELGNRYLDRSVLVETFLGRSAAFLEQST